MMADPKPLFDDAALPVKQPDALPSAVSVTPLFSETAPVGQVSAFAVLPLQFDESPTSPAPAATAEILVQPLILPDAPAAPVVPGIAPAAAIAVAEHSSVAQAMIRGEQKFPEIMKDSGFLIRNNLNRILPVSFDTLAGYGSDTLQRAAGLIGEVAKAMSAVHDVNAEAQIRTLVDHADSTRRKSLRDLIGASLHSFDANQAVLQLGAIRDAVTQRLGLVKDLAEQLRRVESTLGVEVATMAILGDMTDRGDVGVLVIRKGNLFQTSLQEVSMAIRQLETTERQGQEWVLRCDEVCTLVLPALGFRNGLTQG